MVDVVTDMSEGIYQLCTEVGVHPKMRTFLVRQHEEILTLQKAVNEQMGLMQGLLEVVALSQIQTKSIKDSVSRIEKKFGDPYRDEVKYEEAKKE